MRARRCRTILILPALPAFLAKYPEIHVECGVSDRPADLIGENVDCVIRGGPLLEPSLVARHIGDLRWITCATPRLFREVRPTDASRRDLQSGHVLAGYFFPRSGRMRPLIFRARRQAHRDFAEPACRRERQRRAFRVAARRRSASGNCCRSWSPCNNATDELETVLKEWQPEAMPVHVLYPANRHLSTKVRVFVDWAAELFSQSPCTRLLTSGGVKNSQRLSSSLALATAFAAQAAPPHLEKHGTTQQLIVDGKPFLILGGELGNSSASSADYMRPHWPRLKAMNLNTVLAPVTGISSSPSKESSTGPRSMNCCAMRARTISSS